MISWHTDRDFIVRAALAADPKEGGRSLRVRDAAGGEWRTVQVWDFEETGGVVGWNTAGDGVYVLSSLGSDTTRLVELDAATGEVCVDVFSCVDVIGWVVDVVVSKLMFELGVLRARCLSLVLSMYDTQERAALVSDPRCDVGSVLVNDETLAVEAVEFNYEVQTLFVSLFLP